MSVTKPARYSRSMNSAVCSLLTLLLKKARETDASGPTYPICTFKSSILRAGREGSAAREDLARELLGADAVAPRVVAKHDRRRRGGHEVERAGEHLLAVEPDAKRAIGPLGGQRGSEPGQGSRVEPKGRAHRDLQRVCRAGGGGQRDAADRGEPPVLEPQDGALALDVPDAERIVTIEPARREDHLRGAVPIR